MELMRAIQRSLQPVHRKIRMMLTRGVVQLVEPATLLQQLQLKALGGELLDNIEHWEPYGYTSRPHPGAEALLASLGGDRDHTVAVNVADRRYRLKGLAAGEVALFTDEGDVIHFKRNNEILIDTAGKLTANAGTSATITSPLVNVVASTKVTLDTPQTDLTGMLNVTGLITGLGGLAISGGSGASVEGNMSVTGGDVDADGISLKTHVHPGDSGGTTGEPQ
ncbi:phage baseplate assembly protein V [Thiohalophilus sp.]|uniref:phage baseplate assembly protein V n=1 Tax=Thiohalophilus sp. TaxID=3028392 RepID=UPI002ACF083C|nr:phage baseplate assembly protein V [Thiohalophilus sp.]MDZ7804344.1 phage baseplate assembly protein V [Thiohalophilus sp.]